MFTASIGASRADEAVCRPGMNHHSSSPWIPLTGMAACLLAAIVKFEALEPPEPLHRPKYQGSALRQAVRVSKDDLKWLLAQDKVTPLAPQKRSRKP